MVTSKDEVVGKNIRKVLLLSLILMFVTSFGNIGTVSAMSAVDTDGDGCKDGLESSMGTDPNLTDTDNDGLIDSDDPNPISIDADGDELTDIQEFTYGTSSYTKDTDGDGETDKVELDKKTNPTYGEAGTITEVAVTGEDAVDAGTTSDYDADVTGTKNYDHSVTWTVEDSQSATEGTSIDEDGVLTVAVDEMASTLTIKATSVQDDSKVGSMDVTVNPTITGVTVKGDDSVQVGSTAPYEADVTGTGNYDHAVTWTVEGSESVTGETTINENGVLTVADDEMASTLMIKATSVQDDSKVGSKEVTVNPPIAEVTGVKVTGKNEVDVGSTVPYKADVTGTGDYDDSVTWTVEDSQSATEGTTIDEDGVLTVADDEMASTLTIKATSVQDDSKVGSMDVKVNPTIKEVTVEGSDSVQVGSTAPYAAKVTGNGNYDPAVTWTVEDSQSATFGTSINENGILTVADDEMASTLTIKATSVQDDSKVGSMDVKVTPVLIVSGPTHVAKGSTGDYEADISGTEDDSVEWTVAGNNDANTTIDSTGKLTVATTETADVLTVKATSIQNPTLYDEMEVLTTTEPIVTDVVLEDEDGDGIFVTNEAVIATITFANVIDETITDVELIDVEGEQVVEDSYSYSDNRATVEVAFDIPGDGSKKMGTEQPVANITEIVQNGAKVDVADENIIADIAGYGIYNEDQLQFIDLHPEKGNVDAVFYVMDNIDASSIADFDSIDDFSATFDGQDYTISGYYSTTNGLFDETLDGAVIKNVSISGTVVYTDLEINEVGLLIGYAKYTTIENCSVSGNVTMTDGLVDGEHAVGGLVGYAYNSTVENCYATGDVSGHARVGGLIGWSHESTISNSYATGKVESGYGGRVGGFVGISEYSTISNCYATGEVTTIGGDYVGGFAGTNKASSSSRGTINNCYATGNANGDVYVGGFIGKNFEYNTISYCYSTGDADGTDDVTNVVKGFAGSNASNATIIDCYAYEYQLIKGELVKDNESLAGTGDTNYVATYDDLCNSNWYMEILQMGDQFIYQDGFYPQLKNSVTSEEIPGQVDKPIKQPSKSEEQISDKITQPIEDETDTLDKATQNTDVIDGAPPPVEDGAYTLEEETPPIGEGTGTIEESTDTIEEATSAIEEGSLLSREVTRLMK